MTGEELIAEIEGGRLRPAYLLAGSEPLLRDDALDAIEAGVFGAGPRDFDLDRVDVARATPGRLEEALASLPVLAPRRLVVVREGDGRGGKLDGGWTDAIEAWVTSAEETSTSVLAVVVEKADRRSRWVKAFRDPAVRIDCDPPKGARDVGRFLAQEATRQGVTLAPEAARLLAERVGPQLLMLRQEIEKASLLAGPGERIERSHVESSVADVAEEPIWDLTDAIGQGKTADALDLLGRLLHHGAAPPAILGALASHFRRLVRVGQGERVAGPPFVIRKLEQQAGRYAPDRRIACLRAIHRTDVELKGGSVLSPERALEQLVLVLAS